MLAPSLSESIPFYQPRSKRLSLPKLVESFSLTTCHLTELTFAPLFVGSTLTFGNMDEVLTVSSLLCNYMTLTKRVDVPLSVEYTVPSSPHSPRTSSRFRFSDFLQTSPRLLSEPSSQIPRTSCPSSSYSSRIHRRFSFDSRNSCNQPESSQF